MTLEKAIKILANDLIPNYPYAIGPKARAIGLGIESMKWVKRYRPRNKVDNWSLLPGETEK